MSELGFWRQLGSSEDTNLINQSPFILHWRIDDDNAYLHRKAFNEWLKIKMGSLFPTVQGTRQPCLSKLINIVFTFSYHSFPYSQI